MLSNNRKDYADLGQLKKMVEAVYQKQQLSIKELVKKTGKPEDYLDYDFIRVQRRINATIKTMPMLLTHVNNYCSATPFVFSPEEEWTNLNMATFYSYELMEKNETVTLAVAMWMLDQTKASSTIKDAIRILPRRDKGLGDIKLPKIWDSCHSDEILRGMVYAIQQRNADCIMPKKYSYLSNKNTEKRNRFFMDDFTTLDIHRQQVPSRQRFESLISLIPQDTIEQAVRRCEEKMWEWTERFYRCRALIEDAADRLRIRENEIILELDRMKKESKKKNDALRTVIKTKGPVMSPLLTPPIKSLLDMTQDTFISEMDMEMGSIERTYAEKKRIDKIKEDLATTVAQLQCAVQFANPLPEKHKLNMFGKEVSEILAGFSVDDPYEICFGMLYLIDQGSDLPWMYFMGLSVLHQACIHLPWYHGEYDEKEDLFWPTSDTVIKDDTSKAGSDHSPSSSAVSVMPDWYRLDYEHTLRNEPHQPHFNLAQIFYEVTGAIMPRNLHRYDPALLTLASYGIKGKKATLPLLYCMTLTGEVMRQGHDAYKDILKEDPDVVKKDAPEVSTEQLLSDLSELKEVNKRLEEALHQAHREDREHREQIEDLVRGAENQRQELGDLRELLFNRNEGTYEDDTPSDPSITFPYETKHRTLIFGGHDSWIKEMKPRFPAVRFVSKDVSPDLNLLRNADMIWIQTNCLSHKQYDIVMGVARRQDTPVRYFTYASAIKCAEQVVREDNSSI